MSDMTDGSMNRLRAYASAARELTEVIPTILTAQEACANADLSFEVHGEQLDAIVKLLAERRERIEDQALEVARQVGWQVATYEIAPIAKESGDEPIAWITGNSHMPPLRAFGLSDEVWSLGWGDTDIWAEYVEAIERRLDELSVLMSAPEYDNALYVVDLARFDHVDEDDMPEDADDLQSRWRKR